MPELPEVEYTARQLRAAIVGATIRDAQVFWERTISHPEIPDFLAEIAEQRITAVRRRGKFLILDLSGDLILTIHRRMTGNLLLLPPGWNVDTTLRDRRRRILEYPRPHISQGCLYWGGVIRKRI